MDDYSTYYVYVHKDEGEIVYVGIGRSCRAFRATGSGHRDPEHKAWLEAQYAAGKIPVSFTAHGLTREEAVRIEGEMIRDVAPRFNKLHHPDYVSPNRKYEHAAPFMRQLREAGYSYGQIGYLTGMEDSLVCRKQTKNMTTRRICNAGD